MLSRFKAALYNAVGVEEDVSAPAAGTDPGSNKTQGAAKQIKNKVNTR